MSSTVEERAARKLHPGDRSFEHDIWRQQRDQHPPVQSGALKEKLMEMLLHRNAAVLISCYLGPLKVHQLGKIRRVSEATFSFGNH